MASKSRLDQYKIDNYDEIVKQRDTLAKFLGKLLDIIHSAECNCWEMESFDFKRFSELSGWTERSEFIRRHNYYIGQIDRFFKRNVEPFFDRSITADKIKLTPEYIQALGMLKDIRPDEHDDVSPRGCKITTEDVCRMLIMFGHEYRFGHKYPGADMVVYSSAFSDILRCALYAMKVKNDPKAIREFACKCIDEAEKKAKSKRKKS